MSNAGSPRSVCPHCGSGDVEALLPRRHPDDDVVGVPAADRRCLVCNVSWEMNDLDLDRGEQLA